VKYSDRHPQRGVQSNRYITDRFSPTSHRHPRRTGAKVKLRRVADTQTCAPGVGDPLHRQGDEKAISARISRRRLLREREIELKEKWSASNRSENIGDELMEVTKKDVEEIISS